MGKAKANPAKKSTEPSLNSVIAPKGKPKSGRVWKSQKQRASTVRKHKRDSFEKKQEQRQLKKSIQEQSRAIIEQKKTDHKLKREREAENKRRKEENAKKSEIVQVIRNTSKLKRMKKKQLRQVETRDTTVVEKSA
ncbi:Coiled-coil domain-containing protein 86 [Orchesella cincta]|uniref:Coiled-coil domain-containing protein 86 n=1 Tax=Orchesella cincta TaxID=48709 RepID=A0A1D2MUX0_ORCCI|nr:Coiled-coil domain-containing protein 86 [Orchesella cincta]